MKAEDIYKKLENDFIKPNLTDEWTLSEDLQEFLTENFKKRAMGLMFDFTENIHKVYTAVFPSNLVMKKLMEDDISNAMLFVHHPRIWDIRKAPKVFHDIDKDLLLEFKKKNISIYNLHVPLDNFSKYSTTVTLANELGVDIDKEFVPYFGAMCGVFGKVDTKSVTELALIFEKVLGHKVKTYEYGESEIRNSKVAVVAGGGNDIEILREVVEEGINTFVTGITALNDHSKKSHEYAKENKLNILGGSHYSTEKFACQKMVHYFKEMGLESEFIPEEPVLEDM